MELYRIGDKLISLEKLELALDALLRDRSLGATQEQAAKAAGVARSFVSNLETLGEIRHGARVALIAFPVSNGPQLVELARRYSLDFTLVFSQDERTQIEAGSARDIFNRLLDTLAELNDFDAVVVAASDRRLETFRRVLACEVIGVTLGSSPLDHDVEADPAALAVILERLTTANPRARLAKKRGSPATLVKEWYASKKS